MKIFVKTLSGKMITLELEPNDTILSCKLKLQDLEGIPSFRQYLTFGTIGLKEDERTFADYNIPNEATLRLMFQLGVVGGFCWNCFESNVQALNIAQETGHFHESMTEKNTAKKHRLTNLFTTFLSSSPYALKPEEKALLLRMINIMNDTKDTELKSLKDNQMTKLRTAIRRSSSFITDNYRHRSVDLTSVILDLHDFRCPICYNRYDISERLPRTPVSVCCESKLHCICIACFQSFPCQSCPICQSITPTPVRPSQDLLKNMESILIDLRESCKVSDWMEEDLQLLSEQQPIQCDAFSNTYKIDVEGFDSFAIKVPRVPIIFNDSNEERQILHEVAIALPLSHFSYFVGLHGIIDLGMPHGLGIVMEYVDSPSLAKAIEDGMISELTMKARIKLCLDLCRGLSELHAVEIVHKDLKPENLLYIPTPPDPKPDETSNWKTHIPQIKIIDFGISLMIQTITGIMDREHSSIRYEAPEVRKQEEDILTVMSGKEVDIYSLSLILYEILEGRRIFQNLTHTITLPKWSSQTESIPEVVKAMIEKGWSSNLVERPVIGDFVNAFYFLSKQCDHIDPPSAATTILATIPSYLNLLFNDCMDDLFPRFSDYIEFDSSNIWDSFMDRDYKEEMLSGLAAIGLRFKANDVEFFEQLKHQIKEQNKK